MDRFGRWLARRPLIVVLANLAVTLVLGAWALQLRIENSLESMLPTADPKVEYYNATRAIFGSDDVGGAAINVVFRSLSDTEYLDRGVDGKIHDILASATGPEEFFYTGAAHVKQAAVEMIRRDLFRFTPLALGLVLVVLWLSFRTVRGVLLPVLAIGMALVWTLGALVLDGKAITLGTFILPPLLLVVGASYAIHVMARYYEQVAAGAPADAIVIRAFQRVWLP